MLVWKNPWSGSCPRATLTMTSMSIATWTLAKALSEKPFGTAVLISKPGPRWKGVIGISPDTRLVFFFPSILDGIHVNVSYIGTCSGVECPLVAVPYQSGRFLAHRWPVCPCRDMGGPEIADGTGRFCGVKVVKEHFYMFSGNPTFWRGANPYNLCRVFLKKIQILERIEFIPWIMAAGQLSDVKTGKLFGLFCLSAIAETDAVKKNQDKEDCW